jgi:hypothetical protein
VTFSKVGDGEVVSTEPAGGVADADAVGAPVGDADESELERKQPIISKINAETIDRRINLESISHSDRQWNTAHSHFSLLHSGGG